MNKIELIGRLVKEVEMKKSSKETLIGTFTLAVPRRYVKEGEERKVDFINIVTFGKLAEFASKFYTKGLQVAVCGRLEINNYEDEDGNKKYISQVIAEDLYFADSKKDNNDNGSEDYSFLYANTPKEENNSDDLPF